MYPTTSPKTQQHLFMFPPWVVLFVWPTPVKWGHWPVIICIYLITPLTTTHYHLLVAGCSIKWRCLVPYKVPTCVRQCSNLAETHCEVGEESAICKKLVFPMLSSLCVYNVYMYIFILHIWGCKSQSSREYTKEVETNFLGVLIVTIAFCRQLGHFRWLIAYLYVLLFFFSFYAAVVKL